MERYEYKVVPAPEKGLKAKGLKAPADRFAYAIETAMNELGADGWEYWRAETLPSVERSGLTGSKVTERHLLVFRRKHVEPTRPDRPVERPVMPETRPAPVVQEPELKEKTPVFTRRLELAREHRQAVIHRDGDASPTPHIRPVEDD
ncbi:DUF4177 domain-containing protein [Rhodobacterales bacterium HKCCE2091]|nr:DUF4177 domain-containing protein [Rhodobacterales bacterium HKCCE2091]